MCDVCTRSHSPSVSQGVLASIPHSSLEHMVRIGNGCFGEVYKCSYNLAEVAVKKTLLMATDTTSLEREKRMLGSILPHPNVVRVIGFCDDSPDQSLLLVMEYCPGGSVKSYLNRLPLVRPSSFRLPCVVPMTL